MDEPRGYGIASDLRGSRREFGGFNFERQEGWLGTSLRLYMEHLDDMPDLLTLELRKWSLGYSLFDAFSCVGIIPNSYN